MLTNRPQALRILIGVFLKMTAREMWLVFSKKNKPDTDDYEAWSFGDDPEELARLVLEGKKTATASVY